MRTVIDRIVVCALAGLAFVITGPVQLTGAAPLNTPPSFLLKWGDAGSGDGQFSRPQGLAVDASGNIYVADSGNNRIQKFTNTGVLITAWGTWGFGDGQFSNPQGVAVAPSGDVYVMDSGNGRIQKFTSDGGFINKWGAFGPGDSQFFEARCLAVDASGNVYVADMGNSRIQKFTAFGTFITKWGDRGSGDGQFTYPMAVAVDASGDVYVADSSNSRIQKFNSSGGFITKWGTYGFEDGQFNQPQGLTIDTSGDVYVADSGNSRIQKFTSDGGFINKWGEPGSDNGLFNQPCSVAVDAAGNVYVTDTGNNRIQVFGSPSGGDIVELTVYETIIVTDSAAVLPPVVLTVNEDISVADAPAALPPVVLTVNENISVADAPMAVPPVVLTVTETISVADGIIPAAATPPVTVIASVSGGHGTVSPSSQFAGYNTSVSVSIVPDAGYHIAGIVDNGVPSVIANPYVISNATVNHTLMVTFAVNTYTITASSNDGGSISPSGPTSVNYGSSRTFTIVPETGYSITDVIVDGVSVGSVSSFTFTGVTSDHRITVIFNVTRVTYESLGTAVEEFVTKRGVADSLLSKLDNAKAAEAKGNDNAKAAVIRAFINEIKAQTGKAISAGDAARLIAMAETL